MKFLLAAINAKYIHSNLGVYSIKKYADEKLSPGVPSGFGDEEAGDGQNYEIEIGEYTINHQMDEVLQDIYGRGPDVAAFSCYIWNIRYVLEIVRDLKKVCPRIQIWLGGPEASYDAEGILNRESAVDVILIGEGEETFLKMADRCLNEGLKTDMEKLFAKIPGTAFRNERGAVVKTGPAPLMSMDLLPFPYQDLSGLEHRIIYYESSRGCPFSCSYCLSSIDKTVRFRNTELVKKELLFFLKRQVPQVKFVDRTFNCHRDHAIEIWRFIKDHDNGITNFHFEISSDLLDEEELSLLKELRPGQIQLEIGVQSTNPETIRAIRRTMDLKKVRLAVEQINGYQNIHQHLDLIAGLPYEDYKSFARSFNDVYAMAPDQLQLGFLKVLKGSLMEELADRFGLLYRTVPPYEVLSTSWLSYEEVIGLKRVEEMVEVYYNSGQFRNTMKALSEEFSSPFEMYQTLARHYEENGLNGVSHSRLARYEILYSMIEKLKLVSGREQAVRERLRDLLMYDLYLRENVKSRPSFARDPGTYREAARRFFVSEARQPVYLKGYEAFDSRQISKMAHIEGMGDGTLILFDYKNREALFGNARTVILSKP